MTDMSRSDIEIDGRMGEGGGQVIRTSLSLAATLGRPVTLRNIRAGRKRTGLLRQHRSALRAVRDITGGHVEGDALGSSEARFVPGDRVSGGHYHVSIGSAGSTMLVLQTALPPLLFADGPSVLTLQGGTHNPAAPPFDMVDRSFLPSLAAMGAEVEMELVRPGYYPAGGGEVRVHVQPVREARRFQRLERGPLRSKRCQIHVSGLPDTVAEREWKAFQKKAHWTRDTLEIVQARRGYGTGNVAMAHVTHGTDGACSTFTSFGARERSSETVGKRLAVDLLDFLGGEAAVDEHLADQLMLPLALLAGGSYRTGRLSSHAATNMEVINLFLPGAVAAEPEEDGRLTRVTVTGRRSR